jgi:hypothetical protein
MKKLILLLLILVSVSCIPIVEDKNVKESSIDIKLLKEAPVISKIIDKPVDLSNMPSYCDPKKYTITRINGKYFVTLPGGTIDDNYDTPEKAQYDINERAKHSYERWVLSGGNDF